MTGDCTLFVACVLLMKFSRVGRNIRAVTSHPELSNITGIHSDTIILQAFAIGSALVAVAGILIAFDTDMTPSMKGLQLSMLSQVVALRRNGP